MMHFQIVGKNGKGKVGSILYSCEWLLCSLLDYWQLNQWWESRITVPASALRIAIMSSDLLQLIILLELNWQQSFLEVFKITASFLVREILFLFALLLDNEDDEMTQ